MGEGKIYICPTPIGNMGDVSARVLDVLRQVDSICAEDTRITGKITKAHDIGTRIERLDEATMGKRLDALIARVAAGEKIAYCSDAGMPGVSDPGLRLVRAAQEAGIAYEVLPGPSAVSTAYVASGFTHPHFFFGGFLPRKTGELKTLLSNLSTLDAILIFYESPRRLSSSLATIAEAFPLREIAVCRELTKIHEEMVRLPAAELCEFFAKREAEGGIKGEIVVLIDAPNEKERAHDADERTRSATERAHELKARSELSNKDIAATLQAEFGLARNAAYEIVLAL